MALTLKEVLIALDQELKISYVEDKEIPLSRAVFDYVLITRAGLGDARTHAKYWNLLRTAKILETTNQYKGALILAEFRKVFAQIGGGGK